MKIHLSVTLKFAILASNFMVLGACSDSDFQGRSQTKSSLSTSLSGDSSGVSVDGKDGTIGDKAQGKYETASVGDVAGTGPGQANEKGKMRSCQKLALDSSHAEAENDTGKGTADAQGDEVNTYAEAGDGYVFACASSSSSSGNGTAVSGANTKAAP